MPDYQPFFPQRHHEALADYLEGLGGVEPAIAPSEWTRMENFGSPITQQWHDWDSLGRTTKTELSGLTRLAHQLAEAHGGVGDVFPETAKTGIELMTLAPGHPGAGAAHPFRENVGINLEGILRHLKKGQAYEIAGDPIPIMRGVPAHEIGGHRWMYRALKHDPDTLGQLLPEYLKGFSPTLGAGLPPSKALSGQMAEMAPVDRSLIYNRLVDQNARAFMDVPWVQERVSPYAATNGSEYIAEQMAHDIVTGGGPAMDMASEFSRLTGMRGATNPETLLPLAAGLGGLFLTNQLTHGGVTGAFENVADRVKSAVGL